MARSRPAPGGSGVPGRRRLAAGPREPPPGGRPVQQEREPADRSDSDGGAGHGIGEVVPLQADDGDGNDHPQRARRHRDQHAQQRCLRRPRRDEKQHRDRRGQREDGCGVPARVDDVAPVGAVDQGLEQDFVQPDRDGDGHRGEHGAVKPAGEQAGGNDGHAQHARRDQRARGGKPQQQATMAAQPGNDPRVDRAIEPVRADLVCEQHAEHGHEDRAAGQQGAGPGAGAGGQQGPPRP